VAGEGRTVLFVSHNMGTINALCSRGILLSSGQVQFDGTVYAASECYIANAGQLTRFQRANATLELDQWIESAEISYEDPHLIVRLVVFSRHDRQSIVNVRLKDALGGPLGMASLGGFDPDLSVQFKAGRQSVVLSVELPRLANGSCSVDLDLEVPYGHFLDRVEGALAFDVVRRSASEYGRILLPQWGVGSIELPCQQVGQ